MNFDFAAAKSLYDKAIHPRITLGPDDLPVLRRRAKTGDGLKVMTALRKRVRLLVKTVLAAEDLTTMLEWKSRNWSDPGILLRMGLDDIAMVAVLDEDADTLEAMRRIFAAAYSERGIKANIVLSGVAFDLMYHHLPEATRVAYRAASIDVIRARLEATRLSIFKGPAGNITLGTALAGLPLLLAIQNDPGVCDLKPELAQLIKITEAVLFTTSNLDGYPEEDTGYGTGVAAEMSQMAESLRRAGLYDPYKQCPHYARFGQSILHFVQPWGENLANTGDHGSDFQQREFILARLAAETRDPSLLWLAGTLYYTHGMVHPENTLPDYYVEVPLRKNFRVPATSYSLLMLHALKGEKHPSKLDIPTAYRDRGRGLVTFRSSWDADATFVVFDGSQRSPAAPGHYHDSAGHFSLSALGEYFAVDNGRYNNEQSCHNVTLIEGKSGRPLNGDWGCNYNFGRLTDFSPNDFCDTAAVDSSHQHNCAWAWRTIGLVKAEGGPAYAWTVDDINKDNKGSDFWWTLNTSPENTIEVKEKSATITGWRHGNLLDVHVVIPPASSYRSPHTLALSQDVNGASAIQYLGGDLQRNASRYARPSDQLHGALYLRPRLIAKVTGVNGKLLSLMLPRKKNASPATVEQLPTIDNAFAVKITFDKVEDTLIWAYQHHLLEANGVNARGNWCVVRRARKGGALLAHAGGDLSSMVVDGKKVRLAK